ncbi:YsnF/AvaK domain-containing protein [Paracoccus shandongensis]|uniref:YsnF/AvaK domain-containing protein n=1 Tax=Paracoccus shandongensis TaxID=2816048 RepID=UPI001F4385EB|nr:YsnF/AvaK domain-containing protein [Paracoccus shandongensis]
MTYDNEVGTTGTTSVSALFDSEAEAQRAVDRLVQAGIPSASIRMVAGGSGATTATAAGTDNRDKGFWDSLGDFFFPDEDRYAYAEGLSRGGYLVTVTGLAASHYDLALDILDDEGSVNLDEREQSWRSEGWGGYEASPYASGTAATAGTTGTTGLSEPAVTSYEATSLQTDRPIAGDTARMGTDETIPVIEERLRVGKRETAHGRVRVRAYTVEQPVSESVELREEHVEIERRPVDRPLDAADVAFQDRTLEAEEYREEAVVQKEARVVEEIGLRKTSDTHRETISDTVRHTEVEIEDDRTNLNRTDVNRTDLDRDRT